MKLNVPIKREPQPSAMPIESPLESEPLAKVYAEQTVGKPAKKKRGKLIGLVLTLALAAGLLLVILKMVGIIDPGNHQPEVLAPTPTPSGEIITGPVNQYATHSATRSIEEAIERSEAAFKNIRFREDAYIPPSLDLNVTL